MKHIIQWNINGFFTHYEQLQILLKQYDPIILCLQETNFKKHQHPGLKKYTTFSKNRNCEDQASGEVFIAVSEQFDAFEILLITDFEAIAVTVQLPNKIHLCNIYLPNSQTLNLVDLEILINQLPTAFILLGDLNSHHYLWGSYKVDSRGENI